MSSTDRILSVLAFVVSAAKPVSPQEIAAGLALPISTVYRLLTHLKTWGFISDSTQKSRYSAGAVSLQMSQQFMAHSFLFDAARPALQRLSSRTQETVALIVSNQYQTICVDMIESPQALRCSFSVGKGQSLTRGASAKTLLAFSSTHMQQAVLSKYLPDPAQQAELQQQLQRIKTQGYGVSVGELDPGVWGAAAPIFKRQALQGIVAIMAPHSRVMGKEPILIQAVLDCAASINEYVELQQ